MNSLDFWEKYSLISDSDSFADNSDKPKKCKFCKNQEPTVSFNNVPHVIPELLGSNSITYKNECDTCNSTFSKYESHLAIFLRPYLTLNNVKGKKRIPKFHSRKDGKGTITEVISSEEGKRELYFNQNLDDFEIDEENKVMHVNFRKSPFKPRHVYKAIARIGISLLPESQLSFYEHVCEWLKINNDDFINFLPHAFITVMTRKKFNSPFANLYKAKNLVKDNEEMPDLTLVLGFSNVVIQLFIPYSTEFDRIHDSNRNLSVNLFPAFAWDDLQNKSSIRIASVDLSSNETISQDQKISFSFRDIERNV